jgi:hypothetical protein
MTTRGGIAFGVLAALLLAISALYFSGVWTVHT